jgi:hypothetical protein
MSAERVAKADFARLHIALARRALGRPVDIPQIDGPVPMFDVDADELAESADRHPSGGDAA